ncbi:MAG: ABC transporter ATP-binding protein, partial [Cytophagaceae bacterium]
MHLLYFYLRRYWGLLALALLLATINQVFSLLDPYIFRKLVDHFTPRDGGTGFHLVPFGPFFWEAIPYVGAMLGVAMVSRIAKN